MYVILNAAHGLSCDNVPNPNKSEETKSETNLKESKYFCKKLSPVIVISTEGRNLEDSSLRSE